MKYVRLLLTGLTVLFLLSMAVTPAALAAKGKGSDQNNSQPFILWPQNDGAGGGHSSGGGPSGHPSQNNVAHAPAVAPHNFAGPHNSAPAAAPHNFVRPQSNNVAHAPVAPQNSVRSGSIAPTGPHNFVRPQDNNLAHAPAAPQNFVRSGRVAPNAQHTPSVAGSVTPGAVNPNGAPAVTQKNRVTPGTANPKGVQSPAVTQNGLTKPGGLATTTQQQPAATPNTAKTNTLTTQKLATALKAMNKNGSSLTQSQLSALASALKSKNLKAPAIKDLNLTNADIQQLLNLVTTDVNAGDTSQQIITDIASLFNSFSSQHHHVKNEESGNDDDNDENNESTPAPVYVYPYSYIPGYSYSFIGATNSMYVDGFGPVPVASIQLSNGQTVTIPVPPYNLSMPWGSFGTYANWAAQFQAQNGRAPTDQDVIDFWISQATAGMLNVTPTP